VGVRCEKKIVSLVRGLDLSVLLEKKWETWSEMVSIRPHTIFRLFRSVHASVCLHGCLTRVGVMCLWQHEMRFMEVVREVVGSIGPVDPSDMGNVKSTQAVLVRLITAEER
jgi:hypothetical protein